MTPIDADALKKDNNLNLCGVMNAVYANKIVDNQPTLDVAPVVHADWKDCYASGASAGTGWVSSCCDMWNGRKSPFCPNCGAKMDGGTHEK